jgi:hypothetical protein
MKKTRGQKSRVRVPLRLQKQYCTHPGWDQPKVKNVHYNYVQGLLHCTKNPRNFLKLLQDEELATCINVFFNVS